MNIDLPFYWKLFWRRLPVMALFVLLFSSLGVITAMKLPETWSASARLLAEAPQIPDNMVRSTVQTDAVEQLDIIQQRLLTRANLIDIANRFDVFENIRQMQPDNVVAAMRRATNVRRSAGRDRATLLTISFTGRSGQIAANVVNEYVTLALEENANTRITSAENTLAFFNQEVDRLSDDLDRQSAEIVTFKTENADALPEDQSYRLGRQTLLQERLARLEREISIAQSQRDEIVRIYQSTGRIQQDQTARTPDEIQLSAAQAALDNALLVYSESHPRVVQLRSQVQRLTDRVSTQVDTTETSNATNEPRTVENALLEANLSELDGQLVFLSRDIEDTQQELARLQDAISRSSGNGIRMGTLERDYQNIQARYNAAVNNLNSARMSERIESTAQGQRISVIENATVPRVPAGPNRPQIASMGAAAGVALAIGYFMLLELLNRTVRRPSELVSRFSVTPIATIPYMENAAQRFWRRAKLVSATAAVLAGVPAILWYVDQNYVPLDLIVQQGLRRLGLG